MFANESINNEKKMLMICTNRKMKQMNWLVQFDSRFSFIRYFLTFNIIRKGPSNYFEVDEENKEISSTKIMKT
jgi:hypothetical protein